ncbi:MAG TPA: insulinase family protein, partial [Tepidisphaeraceae bacterium]|nr:insulinase family protein [Tepidisphaeraceae bacterium]
MKRATGLLVAVVLCLSTVPLAAREPEQKQFPQLSSKIGGAPDRLPPIEYMTDTLPNGLRVVYLPLRQAPVVHVRVMYHVGSKDERADRQGFAHMFEHMMFRGSAHVAPEQHMKLINMVGGISNAFTSFDQTTYVNTVPSEHTEMALWLEADRMASFKVSDAIFQTERKVVAEEWRMRMNQPFGNLFEEYVKRLFTQHSYRWTPIGNMEQLAQSKTAELQDFFNTYYVPNNAILLVSGDIDVAKTKEWVGRYFAWIPKGEKPPRLAPKEPEQTEGRSATVPASVPLSAVVVGARISGWTNDDQYALALLGEILGGGPSSRLYRRLVASDNPLAAQAQSLHQPLEDGGFFGAMGITLRGKNPADVEKALREEIALLIEKGVTADELAKAKTQYRQGVIQQRKTAEQIARNVGEEWMFGGDPARANTELEKVAAMTADDLKKAAATYLSPNRLTVMQMVPDPTGQLARKAMAQAANTAQAPVVPSTDPVKARVFEFPKDYPTKPPIREAVTAAKFAKGTSFDVPVAGGKAQVIVIPDNRLPLASAVVALRRGSHNEPADKTGLGSLTSEMVRRGAGGMTFEQLNTRLDSLGISIDVDDEGDYTELTATAPADQLAEAVRLSGLVLTKPNFDEKEFANLK